jgi:hypothetical protein
MGTDGIFDSGRKAPEVIGMEFAQSAYARMFPEVGSALIADVIGDSARSDAERLDALQSLLRLVPRPVVGLSESEFLTAIESAIEFARTARDSDIRRSAWELLGRSDNAIVAEPLTEVLLYETVVEIRSTAAAALANHQDDSVVRAALESAASTDPSADVRLRANWSLLTRDEQPGFVRGTVLDTRLSADARLTPLRIARTPLPYSDHREHIEAEMIPMDGAALDAIAALVRDTIDMSARNAALLELGLGNHPAFAELLLEEPDPSFRRGVIAEMQNRRNQVDVTLQIEQVRQLESDPGMLSFIEDTLSPPPLPDMLGGRRIPVTTPP